VTHSLEYRALTEAVGVADVSDRTLVQLSGADRAKFLHNLSSNDILRLTPGQGCEAFLLNVKGKVAGHVFVYCVEDSLILDSSPGQGEKIVSHLDRYIIREKVQLEVEVLFAQFLIAGPKAAELLENLGCQAPRELFSHRLRELANNVVFIRRSELVGSDSFTLVCLAAQKNEVAKALTEAGAVWCSPAALEAVRIEAGVPLYGVDITEDNLPQEVNRNDRAISFTKGCYLGQETVARIDALGHVNRTLMGLKFFGAEPPLAGQELKAADAIVGRITSVAFSPRFAGHVALGYLRQGHNQSGARVTSPSGEVTVTALPMQ
jgi:folate-binding protein YgfZ